MHPAFSHNTYVLKPQGLTLTPKFRACDPQDQSVLFSEQKNRWSMPFTTIRLYADEKRKLELLLIEECNQTGTANTYQVTDSLTGEKVGAVAGDWTSWFEDAWFIADSNGSVIARIREKSTGRAILHNLVEGIVPQILYILIGDVQVAELRQKNVMIGHQLIVDFNLDADKLDHRLGIAAAFLIAGHQHAETD
jgi:hypothetical protein